MKKFIALVAYLYYIYSGNENQRQYKKIESDGWFIVTTKGSHRQYKHSYKHGRVTIAGKPSDDIASGTLNSILKQAKLKN